MKWGVIAITCLLSGVQTEAQHAGLFASRGAIRIDAPSSRRGIAGVDTVPRKMDTVINLVKYPQEMNIAYSQLYVLNSDIGDITFFDQGHPDNRQYILNSNIIPNFYVTPRKWAFNVVLTPIVRVRILANQKSLPVRTPSFNPGGQIYFPIDRTELTNYKYIGVGYYHHSNGQDGPPLDSAGNPNLYNGNFVTNYLVANYHFGKITERQNNYLRLGIEAHAGLLKTGDEPAYRDRFGKFRNQSTITIKSFTNAHHYRRNRPYRIRSGRNVTQQR